MLKKYTKSWTIPEYLEIQRRKEQSFSEKILNSKQGQRALVVCIGLTLYAHDVYATTGQTGLDKFGLQLLGIGRKVGYWVCVVLCIKEIIQSVLSGNEVKDIVKIVIKYFIVVASLWYVPQLFDDIPTLFK